MFGDDDLCAAMQIARPGVVTQPRPTFQYHIKRRLRQRFNGRIELKEADVIRDHRIHLRLLQHDLGEPDAVGVARVLPG